MLSDVINPMPAVVVPRRPVFQIDIGASSDVVSAAAEMVNENRPAIEIIQQIEKEHDRYQPGAGYRTSSDASSAYEPSVHESSTSESLGGSLSITSYRCLKCPRDVQYLGSACKDCSNGKGYDHVGSHDDTGDVAMLSREFRRSEFS